MKSNETHDQRRVQTARGLVGIESLQHRPWYREKNQDDWLKDETYTSTIINAYLKWGKQQYLKKPWQFMYEYEFERAEIPINICHCDGMSIRDIAISLLIRKVAEALFSLRIRKTKGPCQHEWKK